MPTKSFDITYPIWAMGNFQLGIQNDNTNIPLTPIDFIEFGGNRNTSYAVNFWPDIWIFPLLNVYGLFGYGASTTEVNLTMPIELKSIVTQNMSTKGFGVMGGFGLGPAWVSIDANWTWTKPELLEDDVLAKVLGVRLGKTFQFASKPERNVAFWVGGMRARMSSATKGQILMSDAIPQETWDRVDEIVDQYNTWYEGLDPIKQGIVDNTPFPAFMESLENREGNTLISYGMDKRPEQEWNMVVGGQFQLNKRWMIRSEAGIIGDRKSFLASINYRFLL
ncbi:porin family protein [Draconibacterium sp.]|nr:porin family protein [Draconibacterium sp.]